MKTFLAIFSLLMASITFWAVRDGINEGRELTHYKDSNAYWKGRYDSVVRIKTPRIKVINLFGDSLTVDGDLIMGNKIHH